MKATWLFSEHPLVIDVKLATVIKLNPSIVLQQLNYWLHSSSAKKINGKLWIYNSVKDWNKQFPFWGINTVQRILDSLEEDGLIESGNFNRLKFDRTKWYTINYEELSKRMEKAGMTDSGKNGNGLPQNGEMEIPKMGKSNTPEWVNANTQNGVTNTRDYTETTTETNNNSRAEPDKGSTHLAERKEIIGYLNNKLGTNYRAGAKKNAERMNARLNEGYSVDDFKKVIDNKYSDWADSPKMARYLRPETLFSPKFESYLNEKQMTANDNQGERDYAAELEEWNRGD